MDILMMISALSAILVISGVIYGLIFIVNPERDLSHNVELIVAIVIAATLIYIFTMY